MFDYLKANHTPGPWKLTIDDDIPDQLHIAHSTLPYIATIFGDEPGQIIEKQLANAQLIARAPAMFEALREIVRLIESPNDTRADILALCDRTLGGL